MIHLSYVYQSILATHPDGADAVFDCVCVMFAPCIKCYGAWLLPPFGQQVPAHMDNPSLSVTNEQSCTV